MWRVFSWHNDNDYDVDNDDVAPRLTWLMGISGETEQLSSPARALASLSLAAPNFGTFCIRVWKKRVYLYSSVFIFICSIWCQCKIVTCFRSYFDLNRFKFVQKIAKSSKRLKREPWPGALLPGAQCCHIHRQLGLSLRSCAKQSPDFLWNSNSQLLDYKSHL